jgi:hypothetical protein
MSVFSDLYGSLLDLELASADTTQRFTTVRRKAAVNAGQREFARLTNCCQKLGSVALVDDTAEYDLEATLTDFRQLAPEGPSIKIVDAAGNVTWIEGESFPRTTVRALARYDSGWQAASSSTPDAWYLRALSGKTYFGLSPAPDIPAGETWTLYVPYYAVPADLTLNTDEPFTVAGDVLIALRPYHQALVHYAAAQLEKLRRDWDAVRMQQVYFSALVDQYRAETKPIGGQRVVFARDYRRERPGAVETPATDIRR